jgi:hypothetical protein
MTRFVSKRLPPHWLFVPTKRQLREFLAGLGADVRLVELQGTSARGVADWLTLGFVEARVVGGEWCFYLRLWGVRESVVGGQLGDLTQAALAAIDGYIRGCVRQPPATTIKPAQMLLAFRLGAEGIASRCRIKSAGRHPFPTPVWWEDDAGHQS